MYLDVKEHQGPTIELTLCVKNDKHYSPAEAISASTACGLLGQTHMDDTSSENETKNAETKTRGSTDLLFYYLFNKSIETQT